MTKVEPCPFCGVVPKVVLHKVEEYTACENKDCFVMGNKYQATKYYPIDLWNKRG